MVDLRSRTHGAGATKGVNLVVLAYDDLIADRAADDAVHFLDVRVHPGDRRAPGQVDLALVPKRMERSTVGFDHAAGYSAEQLEAIEKAAGDNVTDLRDARGEVIGKVYGVKADLLINSGEVVVNTKTLEATALSVSPDVDGRDIRAQIEFTTAAGGLRRAARAAAGSSH
jgi:hypothetical protein